MAKYRVNVLAPFSTNEYTVTNSFSFVSDLKQFSNVNSYHMASFDIEFFCLYTNVPLSETIDIILSILFKNVNDLVIGLSRNLFKQMLELSVCNSFFVFNNMLYKQKDVLGMGLPLSQTFANIFLSFNEKNWLWDCPPDFAPVYTTDVIWITLFLLFRHLSHANRFLSFLNSRHMNINFTIGNESNGSLAFLDVEISRLDGKFCTSVFLKKMFSGLGISFFSFCTFKFKLNSIKTLLYRSYEICSDYFALNNEFNFLKQFF